MKKWKSFIAAFILSYIFWVLFLMQDFNILKLGAQELIAGLLVALVVAVTTSRFFVREDGFWLFKKFRIFNLIIFMSSLFLLFFIILLYILTQIFFLAILIWKFFLCHCILHCLVFFSRHIVLLVILSLEK